MRAQSFTPLLSRAMILNKSVRTAAAAHSSCDMTSDLLDVHGAKARVAGASVARRSGVRAHQEGVSFRVLHHSTFHPSQPVSQLVSSCFYPIGGTQLDQLNLPLYGRINGPSVAPLQYVQMCKTYREAVRMAWALRRIHKMTRQQLASEGEFYAQHVGDWLNPDDKPQRRSLPGDCIPQFESIVGNTLVSQWVAAQAVLTVVEEMAATKAAA